MSIATVLASEAAHVELPMPPVMYGVVTLVILVILAAVTFTYRDVSNRYAARVESRAGRSGDPQDHSHE